jgi:ribose/xylose/arabinose/galactoside ABC-type transport system permease subunit
MLLLGINEDAAKCSVINITLVVTPMWTLFLCCLAAAAAAAALIGRYGGADNEARHCYYSERTKNMSVIW